MTAPDDMLKLAACPFCGCDGQSFKDYWDSGEVDHFGCKDCGVSFESVDEWNTRASAERQSGEVVAAPDGWLNWFPATPADNERGEELFVGGYTWTLHGDDGPKEYKYRDGRWHRLNAAPSETGNVQSEVRSADAESGTSPIAIELMQRIWDNLYFDRDEFGTFQQTLNEVVDWLAALDALPSADRAALATRPATSEREVVVGGVRYPGKLKLVYIKRWRTLIPVPETYADEIVAALGVAEGGRNRDPIFAPDGKTWYQTALDEAAKRGENELRIHELEAKLDLAIKGIRDFTEGNYENPRQRRPEPCAHGQRWYEGCQSCDDAFMEKLASSLASADREGGK